MQAKRSTGRRTTRGRLPILMLAMSIAPFGFLEECAKSETTPPTETTTWTTTSTTTVPTTTTSTTTSTTTTTTVPPTTTSTTTTPTTTMPMATTTTVPHSFAHPSGTWQDLDAQAFCNWSTAPSADTLTTFDEVRVNCHDFAYGSDPETHLIVYVNEGDCAYVFVSPTVDNDERGPDEHNGYVRSEHRTLGCNGATLTNVGFQRCGTVDDQVTNCTQIDWQAIPAAQPNAGQVLSTPFGHWTDSSGTTFCDWDGVLTSDLIWIYEINVNCYSRSYISPTVVAPFAHVSAQGCMPKLVKRGSGGVLHETDPDAVGGVVSYENDAVRCASKPFRKIGFDICVPGQPLSYLSNITQCPTPDWMDVHTFG